MGQLGRGIVWNLHNHAHEAFKELLPPSELIESICYAHDLGHPPFGHGGERALHRGMHAYGGFEGNGQTIRILTRLEKYYRGEGIKPTRRLLLGVLKYPVPYSAFDPAAHVSKPPKCYYDSETEIIGRALSVFTAEDISKFGSIGPNGKTVYKTLDCSIMEIADDIAYGVHDLEDGIARGLLVRESAESAIKDAAKEAGLNMIGDMQLDVLLKKLFCKDSCERKYAISLLVGLFITSVTLEAQNCFAHPLFDVKATLPKEREQSRAARGWLNWTQEELAQKANVSLSTVRDFEKGRRVPVRNNLLAIRHALEQSGVKFSFDGERPIGLSSDD